MEALYGPHDDQLVSDWFESISNATGISVDCWTTFSQAISRVTAATTIGLLKQLREADVQSARLQAGLAEGYMNALTCYLVPKGVSPFSFVRATTERMKKLSSNGAKPLYVKKKFESQQNRTSLGRELGMAALAALEIPDEVLAGRFLFVTTRKCQ